MIVTLEIPFQIEAAPDWAEEDAQAAHEDAQVEQYEAAPDQINRAVS
jgi:hypothetical protein